MDSSNRHPVLDGLRPYWANTLILLLFVGAVTSSSDAEVGLFNHAFALPARWALVIMCGGGYVCGLWIAPASARRKHEKSAQAARPR